MERVATLLVDVSRSAIELRFGRLGERDVRDKGVAEPVTVADAEAEARLTASRRAILPGVAVVAEVACTARPARPDALADGWCRWSTLSPGRPTSWPAPRTGGHGGAGRRYKDGGASRRAGKGGLAEGEHAAIGGGQAVAGGATSPR
ncbi:MAG: hypothetical protein ACRD1K_16845 [Acidimicrobiales bacterium]